jgi:hypothetical protein
MAAPAQSSSLRVASAVHRTRAITRSFGFCMSVVGASRHSAAPGSQSVERPPTSAAGAMSALVRCGQSRAFHAVPPRPPSSVTRDAQLGNREDVPRQAGSRLSSPR